MGPLERGCAGWGFNIGSIDVGVELPRQSRQTARQLFEVVARTRGLVVYGSLTGLTCGAYKQHMCTYVYIMECTYMYTYTCAYVYTKCMYSHTCVYIHIHCTCIHPHVRTIYEMHIRTYIYIYL